jgi:hypothetical protein
MPAFLLSIAISIHVLAVLRTEECTHEDITQSQKGASTTLLEDFESEIPAIHCRIAACCQKGALLSRAAFKTL